MTEPSEIQSVLVAGMDRVFFLEAAICKLRCEGAESPAFIAGAAGSAIVTSCTALEALVSEATTFNVHAGKLTEEKADRIRNADGLHRKLNRLVKHFHPPGLDSELSYPQLVALVRLRHCIVHRHARFLEPGAWPTELKDHWRLIPHEEGPDLDWTSRVLNYRTAEWAVKVMGETFGAVTFRVPHARSGEVQAWEITVIDGMVFGDSAEGTVQE